MHLNWKALTVTGAIIVGLFLFAPQIALAALPLLFFALCPIMMVLMIVQMNRISQKNLPANPEEELASLRKRQWHISKRIVELEQNQQNNTDQNATLERS